MNKEFKKEMRAAVARGVAVLDKVYGKTVWPKRIKLKTFHIDRSCDCVIGQVVAQRSPIYDTGASSHLRNKVEEFWDRAGKDENIRNLVIYDQELGMDMAYSYRNGAEADIETPGQEIYAYLQKIWVRWIRRRKGLKSGK